MPPPSKPFDIIEWKHNPSFSRFIHKHEKLIRVWFFSYWRCPAHNLKGNRQHNNYKEKERKSVWKMEESTTAASRSLEPPIYKSPVASSFHNCSLHHISGLEFSFTYNQWARFGPALQGALRHRLVIWDCTWLKLQQSSMFHPSCSHQAHPPQKIQSPESLVVHQWSLDGGKWLKNSSGAKKKVKPGWVRLGW